MRAGWRERFGLGDMLGLHVGGRRLGIIGMGRIGRAVARRARAFGMKILYHDVSPVGDVDGQFFATLEDMLPSCDVVTLHMPGAPAPILTRERIALLPKGAVVINAARGSLIDEEALLEALTGGALGAAGLDVFRSEPDYDLRFRDLPNVFITPHVGSATVETRHEMGMRCLENIAAALKGERPRDAL